MELNDVVVLDALRTPIGKYRGGLARVHGGGEARAGLLVLLAQRVQRLLLREDARHLAVDLEEHLA